LEIQKNFDSKQSRKYIYYILMKIKKQGCVILSDEVCSELESFIQINKAMTFQQLEISLFSMQILLEQLVAAKP